MGSRNLTQDVGGFFLLGCSEGVQLSIFRQVSCMLLSSGDLEDLFSSFQNGLEFWTVSTKEDINWSMVIGKG